MAGRFDWYQATVKAEVGPLMGALAEGLGGRWEALPKAPHGYRFGSRLQDDAGPLATLWWGGCHELPHVVGSGEAAHQLAQWLRGEFGCGQHRVSRADACIDYAEPGAYDRLQGLALSVAEEQRIKVNTAGDHLLTRKGRTLYLGAPTSHTRLRLYDKAEEMRQACKHDPVRLAQVPSELARFECQVRPQTPLAKIAAGQASPVELMGSSAWMRELMRRVCGLDLEPFEAGKPWRQADDDRAYAAMLSQYGGLLQRICGDLGSWECVGRQIGDDLAARAAHAKR